MSAKALRVFALLGALLAVSMLTFVPPSQNDFWLQARIGRMILESGEIPRTVLFAFTEARGNRFNAHEWLPSLAFHAFDRLVGHDRLVLIQGLFGLLLFALSALLAWRVSKSIGTALLLGLCAMAVANCRHFLRPELFALALLLLLLLVLVSYQQRQRAWTLLWSLPIGLVWANAHGSSLLGPVVAGLFAVGESAQSAWMAKDAPWSSRLALGAKAGLPYALAALGLLLVSGINPLGFSLLHFALTLSVSEATKASIYEWSPTLAAPFISTAGFAIFALALFATAVLLLLNRSRLRVADVLLVAVFAMLALQRNRFVVLFGFVAIVPCARAIAGHARETVERSTLGATGVLSLAAVALALKFGNVRGDYPFYSSSLGFTQPMLERLAEPRRQGPVFNSYELGAELIYRAWPRLQPSMDSRIDSYGDAYFLNQISMLSDEQALRQFLDRYGVRYMLLLWRDAKAIEKMQGLRDDGWHLVFGDHKMVLLERPAR